MELNGYPKGDPIKNWKDAAEYKDHGNSKHAWAWEYLRRNKEYQDDYKQYQKWLEHAIDDEGAEGSTYLITEDKLNKINPEQYYFDPPLQDGQSVAQWFLAYADYQPLGLAKMHHLKNGYYWKWRMQPPMRTPAVDDPPEFVQEEYPRVLTFNDAQDCFGEPIGAYSGDAKSHEEFVQSDTLATYDFQTGTLEPHSALLFDLDQPIDLQVKRAKEILRTKQALWNKKQWGKQKITHHKDPRIRYLRFIDAYYSNADWTEMVSLLKEYVEGTDPKVYGINKIIDQVKQAYALVSKKYRTLI